MALLGNMAREADPTIERGLATEARANQTLEMIWCLEDHCPASAQDWDPRLRTTRAAARASRNYNLTAFASRKRPTPQYTKGKAHEYYGEALGHVPAHCPSLEYLTELHLAERNTSAAASTAERLCGACGASSTWAGMARAGLSSAAVDTPSACIPDEDTLGGGAIAGIVCGSVVAIALGAWLWKRGPCAGDRAAPSSGAAFTTKSPPV